MKSNEMYKLLILYQTKFNTVNMMFNSPDEVIKGLAQRIYDETKNNLINEINKY